MAEITQLVKDEASLRHDLSLKLLKLEAEIQRMVSEMGAQKHTHSKEINRMYAVSNEERGKRKSE